MSLRNFEPKLVQVLIVLPQFWSLQIHYQNSISSFDEKYVFFRDFLSFPTLNIVLSGIFQLICWSGTVVLSFSFNSLNCFSEFVLLFFIRFTF